MQFVCKFSITFAEKRNKSENQKYLKGALIKSKPLQRRATDHILISKVISLVYQSHQSNISLVTLMFLESTLNMFSQHNHRVEMIVEKQQPNTADGHCSSVHLADFEQVFPHRVALMSIRLTLNKFCILVFHQESTHTVTYICGVVCSYAMKLRQ